VCIKSDSTAARNNFLLEIYMRLICVAICNETFFFAILYNLLIINYIFSTPREPLQVATFLLKHFAHANIDIISILSIGYNLFACVGTGVALRWVNSEKNIEQRRIHPCLNSKRLSTD